MAKKYIKVYLDLMDALEPLDDGERGRLFTAMLEYGTTGAATGLVGNERFLFPMIRGQLDRDGDAYAARCQTNAENGRLGGAPPGNHNRNKRSKPTSTQDEDKEKDEDQDQEKDEEQDEEIRALGGAFAYLFDKINPNPGNMALDELRPYVERLGDDVCIRAMDIALGEKSTGWAFIEAILQRYARDGVRCLADAIDSDKRRKQGRAPRGTSGGNLFLDMLEGKE